MVHHQVLLGVDIYDMDAIAINKLCKLNISYFTMYLTIMSAAGLSDYYTLNMVCY